MKNLTCLAALLATGVLSSAAPLQADLNSEIKQVIDWLPTDTESVQVVKPNLHPPKPTREFPPLLDYLRNPIEPQQWPQVDIPLYTVMAARIFDRPHDIGLGHYEGVSISAYDSKTLKELTEKLAQGAQRTKELRGATVYVSESKDSAAFWITSTCVVGDKIITATDERYLDTLLERMHGKFSDRALPDTLEEWKYVDKTAPLWGIRHFTERARHMPNGLNMEDDKMVGYGISGMSDGGLSVVSLSDNPTGFDTVKNLWGHDQRNPDFKQLDSRATLIRFKATGDDPRSVAFILFAALGYAVFV